MPYAYLGAALTRGPEFEDLQTSMQTQFDMLLGSLPEGYTEDPLLIIYVALTNIGERSGGLLFSFLGGWVLLWVCACACASNAGSEGDASSDIARAHSAILPHAELPPRHRRRKVRDSARASCAADASCA
eukprot:790666-Rhodomonas_salina.2